MGQFNFSLPGAGFIVALALLFAFSNGFRDSSTIVATVVSTRALTPTMAFLFCALFEFSGAFFVGSAVAVTISRRMFGTLFMEPHAQIVLVLGSAVSAAVIWGIISWWRAWPTSNNHSLFAGLTGASWAAYGTAHLKGDTILMIFAVLVLSPLLGFILSVAATSLVRYAGEWMTPRILPVAERLHVASCFLVSVAHGSNDGQLVMGVLLLGLGLVGGSTEVPSSVRLVVASTLALGVLMGGRRLLKKLGMSFYRIQVTQGFGAQLTSALTVLFCAANGFPASTTQVITGSIIGAGMAKNPRALKWNVAQDIALAWILTLPAVALLASIMFYGATLFFQRGV
jgi:inorganic phosphate transporter, PiT family